MTVEANWQSFGLHFPEETLALRVADHARARPDEIAVISGDDRLTWRELDQRANALAAHWIGCGLKPGDRLGWLGRNQAAFPIVLVATRRARLVLVGLNWRLSPAELATIVAMASCDLIVADAEFAPLLRSDAPIVETRALIASLTPLAQPPESAPQPDDPTTLFFSSGTTGRPKGFVYSLETVERCVNAPHTLDFTPDSRLVIVAPVFHTAGWVWSQYALAGGMTQILLPAAPPAAMLGAVAEHRATHAQWVPTMLTMALDEYDRAPVDLSSLRLLAYGAAPIQPSLLARAQATFECDFVQVYGLTETVGPVSHLPPAAHRAEIGKSQATGIVNPGVELVIRDAGGAPIETGLIGELWVRMPFPRARVLDPAQGEAIPENGWIRTGDAGFLDQAGYLHVCDRIGDMIITGGENVYPAEVEDVLAALPGVREAAVFGAPDPHWGQCVCGAVVMRDGAGFDAEAMIAACRQRLAHYKCPRRIVALEELPKNATGKVLRRTLAERIIASAV